MRPLSLARIDGASASPRRPAPSPPRRDLHRDIRPADPTYRRDGLHSYKIKDREKSLRLEISRARPDNRAASGLPVQRLGAQLAKKNGRSYRHCHRRSDSVAAAIGFSVSIRAGN
jgi:hypothetical protein